MLSKEEKLLYSLSSIKEILETLGIDVEVTLTKNDNKYTINAYKEIEKCVVDYVNSLQPYKFEELKKVCGCGTMEKNVVLSVILQ